MPIICDHLPENSRKQGSLLSYVKEQTDISRDPLELIV